MIITINDKYYSMSSDSVYDYLENVEYWGDSGIFEPFLWDSFRFRFPGASFPLTNILLD